MHKLQKLLPSKKKVLLTSAVFGGFTGFGCYMHPQLRENPQSFAVGYRRYLREVAAGIRIGCSYKWNQNNITSELHTKNAKILYEMMRTNGGVYIKAGQSIAQMESLIPDEWIEIFEPMQQAAPTSPIEDVKRIVEEDIGRPLKEVFSEFSETPVASASLAQVHKAVLRETGELVAVKVQHPQILYNTEGDLAMCVLAGKLCDLLFTNFRYKWAFDETAKELPKELDFRKEMKNA